MASGSIVDAIEVVETSFASPAQHADDHLDHDQSTDEDNKSTGEKSTGAQHDGSAPKTPVGVPRNKSERERKIGHRRVGVGGEITYKKIQTSQIMGSIQLGIQHAVGGLAGKPERDLLMQDFMAVETTNFPSEGSNHTPAHHFSEFKFKNYAPIAFRYFRDLFGIQPDDFLMSMCSAPLRELSNPGASGSIFYLTDDDEFIIKTVQHKEGEFLQTLLPGYYMNLNQNPRTLLPKFFGLYCYRCNSKNIRLIAMNNLLPSSIKLHQKYDLKGSTYKRKASKPERAKSSPTYKDLDFMEHHPEGIFLEADTYNALVKTMQRDCRVLESFKIMDYSLLVGIHNLDQAAREKVQEQRLPASTDDEVDEVGGESGGFIQAEREERTGATALNRSRSINRQRLVAHSTAMESIQAASEPIDEEDDVPSPGGIPARNARGERLLLFVGIIDILQSYRLKKKLEHTWKSMIHDGDTVSVHRPGFYARRFQDFMSKTVFKKIPSLDLPEIKGNHRKFRNLVTSYIALKHSPSKRKSITKPTRPLDGDFYSTAVAATGSATKHATSPTKAVSPTEVAISTTSTVMTSSSGPIATSTPVNFASGSVPPPPLSLATGQGAPQEATSTTSAGGAGTPGAKASSYPAVLKGRTSASPPIPNLVPSGKVPPPVPPRGTGHRSAATSSASSSRGDEAAIITKYRLHESSSIPHRPPPPSATSTSSSFAVAAASSGTASANTHYNHNHPSRNPEFLHARVSTTPAYLPPPRYDSVAQQKISRPEDVIREEASLREWQRWRDRILADEEDEFVSVEKVDDSYIIRTSPHPFRPERGHYTNREKEFASATPSERDSVRSAGPSKPDTMAKFTYFINPAARPDLMNYRMSRKDKKHSETYYERMKRKQKELEASINTITSLTHRGQSQKNQEQTRERIKLESNVGGYGKAKDIGETARPSESASKIPGTRRDSRLLRKIKEKSAQRRQKLAPEPSPTATNFPINTGNIGSIARKAELQERPSFSGDNREYTIKSNQQMPRKIVADSPGPEMRQKIEVAEKKAKKTFTVTRVDERETRRIQSNETMPKLLVNNQQSGSGVIKVEERAWTAENPELARLSNRSIVSSKVEIFREPKTYLTPTIPQRNSDSHSLNNELMVPPRKEFVGSRGSPRMSRSPKSMAPPRPHLEIATTERYESSKSLPATLKGGSPSPNLPRPNRSFLHSLKGDPRRGTLPSTCSTPPPPFDDAVRSNDQTLASGGHPQHGAGMTLLTSSLSSAQSKHNRVVHHVTLSKNYHDAVSISDVHLESSGSGSGSGGRETKSSLSVESGSSGRGGGGQTWTPPAGSAEGSTPTWTEGTPSFTESSSSGDVGCPTTPMRGNLRHDDGGRIAATVEEALASLTTEMRHTSGNAQELVEESATLSVYRQVRTSFKRASTSHVAIMRSMQRALNGRRREP